MTYKAKIRMTPDKDFYALVVQVDRDGEESVVSGYGTHFDTMKQAERSTSRFIKKLESQALLY